MAERPRSVGAAAGDKRVLLERGMIERKLVPICPDVVAEGNAMLHRSSAM